MSFKGQHMKQRRLHGARLVYKPWTVSELKRLGWKGLLVENFHATGNTRFDPDTPVFALLKYNMNAFTAAKALGYRGDCVAGWNLCKRIKLRDVTDMYGLLIMLQKAGLMPKKCTELLSAKTGTGRWRTAKVVAEFAVEIIYQAVAAHGSLEKACVVLGITVVDVNFWVKNAK